MQLNYIMKHIHCVSAIYGDRRIVIEKGRPLRHGEANISFSL